MKFNDGFTAKELATALNISVDRARKAAKAYSLGLDISTAQRKGTGRGRPAVAYMINQKDFKWLKTTLAAR